MTPSHLIEILLPPIQQIHLYLGHTYSFSENSAFKFGDYEILMFYTLYWLIDTQHQP